MCIFLNIYLIKTASNFKRSHHLKKPDLKVANLNVDRAGRDLWRSVTGSRPWAWASRSWWTLDRKRARERLRAWFLPVCQPESAGPSVKPWWVCGGTRTSRGNCDGPSEEGAPIPKTQEATRRTLADLHPLPLFKAARKLWFVHAHQAAGSVGVHPLGLAA